MQKQWKNELANRLVLNDAYVFYLDISKFFQEKGRVLFQNIFM